MKHRVYLDHAATTPLDPLAFKSMKPFFSDYFGNPGSIHADGVAAKQAVVEAREKTAELLACHSDEIIFTSGGTESNNLAIWGVVQSVQEHGMKSEDIHIITSVIEHASVRDVFRELRKRGVQVSYIPVGQDGIIKIDELKKALKKETVLVSIMYANNEIGTIQPISEIAKVIRNFRKRQPNTCNLKPKTLNLPMFHCDASQVPAYLDVNVQKLGVDLMTLDGQKIYGPKGVGVLYKKREMEIKPILYGGHQENGIRPGTENAPSIIGFAKALEIVIVEREKEVKRMTELRDYFIKKVLDNIKGAELNGDTDERIANNVNMSFPGNESDWIVLQLDARGISVGSKSACLSSGQNKSYVIDELGKSGAHAQASIRFTLGKSTTKKDLDYTVQILKEILTQ
tara:strand:+ start:6115 stop:7311 length:1197 start_codon:yes stop_codon:yes gene_type:complete